jgi:hypothetical protein
MTSSTFYHDGYDAALIGEPCSPPDRAPYYTEYCDGYQDACAAIGREHFRSIRPDAGPVYLVKE